MIASQQPRLMLESLDAPKGIDVADERAPRAPLDLVVGVVVLVSLQVAVQLLQPDWFANFAANSALSFVYNLVFGVVRSLVTLWVLFRLWQLLKRDGAPAQLMLVAIAANVLGLVYSQSWNSLPVSLTVWFDDVALLVRIAGLLALGLALIQWPALERWVGWTILAYVAVLSISIAVGRLWAAGVLQPVVGWAWLTALVVLTAGLLRIGGPTEQ